MTLKEDSDVQFGDFTLKLLGELSPLHGSSVAGEEGFWIASCGLLASGQLTSRIIVIPASTFNSKIKFQENLRKKLGGGVVSIGGGVTGSHISEYYLFLKNEFRKEGRERKVYKTNHMGHQTDNYWCISQEQHVMNSKIVPLDQHRVFVTDDNVLQHYSTHLNPVTLSTPHLREICKRYIELSSNFGENRVPFLLGTAFVLVFRNLSSTMSSIGESNIGVLFSKARNVGKSLTLNILAMGQGLSSKSHPLLCSGGDQNVSGISVFQFLMEFLDYLHQWKESTDTRQGNFTQNARARMFLSWQTYEGFRITINSVIAATKFLLQEGMEFVLTERFCQDPIEEYFGKQRKIGRRSDNPDIRMFGYNSNTIRIQRSVSCQSGNTRGRKDKHRAWEQVTDDKLPCRKKTKNN